MSWTTFVTDVRRLLSDGPKDRLRHRKRVLGQIDGSNVTFKTLEFRRVTDFTTAASPEGVYVNGMTAAVASDSLESGEFQLTTAPVDGDVVEATYYTQWFTDDEINGFGEDAANWLKLGDIANIPDGLKPAALHYCLQSAYQKLSIRWSEMLSETYRLEDTPQENVIKMADSYRTTAMDMHKKATTLRDDFYKGSGRNFAPTFGIVTGNVRDPMPKR